MVMTAGRAGPEERRAYGDGMAACARLAAFIEQSIADDLRAVLVAARTEQHHATLRGEGVLRS